MFSKRYTHSNNKLSIKVENKRGRGSSGAGEVGGAGAAEAADGRQTGWRGDCTRVHPAQVLAAPPRPRAPANLSQPPNFDMKSWHIKITNAQIAYRLQLAIFLY